MTTPTTPIRTQMPLHSTIYCSQCQGLTTYPLNNYFGSKHHKETLYESIKSSKSCTCPSKDTRLSLCVHTATAYATRLQRLPHDGSSSAATHAVRSGTYRLSPSVKLSRWLPNRTSTHSRNATHLVSIFVDQPQDRLLRLKTNDACASHILCSWFKQGRLPEDMKELWEGFREPGWQLKQDVKKQVAMNLEVSEIDVQFGRGDEEDKKGKKDKDRAVTVLDYPEWCIKGASSW